MSILQEIFRSSSNESGSSYSQLLSAKHPTIWIALLSLIILVAGCAHQAPSPLEKTVNNIEQQLDGENLALAWKYEVDGPINDTPIRIGDVVIASPVGGPLVALDATSGQLRWQFEPPGKLWERSYISDGQRIFVGIEGGKLVALNVEDGQLEWQNDFAINVQIAPFVIDSVLYIPTTFVGPGLKADPNGHAKLFAVSSIDGEVLWSFESENYILQTPFRHNDMLYVGGSYYDPTLEVDEGGPMRMYGLSAHDGSIQWVYESEDGFVKAIYATDDTVSYIAYQDFVSGLDAHEGDLLWRKDTGNWVPSLSGAGDQIYFGAANTVVYALDTNTGEPIWQHNIGGGTFNYLLGEPIQVADDLYFLTQRGDIVALDANDGTLKWQFATGVAASRDGLSVSGGWLFLGDGEGNIYAYSSMREGS